MTSRDAGRRALRGPVVVRLVLLALVLALTVVLGVRLADERTGTAAASTATPERTQPAAPSALFVGDSFTEGTGAGDVRRGYACLTAAAMGWNCNVDAQGGTGFVASGPAGSGSERFLDRLDDYAARFLADVVVVDGGRNDGDKPLPDVLAAAGAYLREVRATWPRSAIVVVVPAYVESTPENDPFGVALAEGLRAVVAELGGYLVDPLDERWVAPEQVAGFTWTDGIHPNTAGHEHLARHLIADLVRAGLSDVPVVDSRAVGR